jgi:hypothetical protein
LAALAFAVFDRTRVMSIRPPDAGTRGRRTRGVGALVVGALVVGVLVVGVLAGMGRSVAVTESSGMPVASAMPPHVYGDGAPNVPTVIGASHAGQATASSLSRIRLSCRLGQ